MFNQLPETLPAKNPKKLKAFGAALAIQIGLVAALIVIQMAMPEKLGEFRLLETLYMAPPPPPPAAPLNAAPEPVRHAAAPESTVSREPAVVEEQPRVVTEKEPEVVAPTSIPKDIARIVEAGPAGGAPGGVPGGVRGGIPGGLSGGSLNGILGGAASGPVVPPPPEAGPVRVGGNVREPKIVHIEQPQYPPAAKRTGIQGVVVVEATLTKDGTVEKVKVISGAPLLTEAAADAVSKWKYEPTYLNGQPIEVILTARITFSLSNADK